MCSAWTLANNRRQVQLHSAACLRHGWWLWLWYDALCQSAHSTPPRRAAKVEQFPISKDSAKQCRRGEGVSISCCSLARYIDPATPLTTFSRQRSGPALQPYLPPPRPRPPARLRLADFTFSQAAHSPRPSPEHPSPATRPGRGGWGDCIQVVLLTKTKTIVLG